MPAVGAEAPNNESTGVSNDTTAAPEVAEGDTRPATRLSEKRSIEQIRAGSPKKAKQVLNATAIFVAQNVIEAFAADE